MESSKRLFFSLMMLIGMIASCDDSITIVDTNYELDKRNWSYTERVKVQVPIEDPNRSYHIYLNLRHTSDYKYSNIFLLVHITEPGGKRTTERKEFKLALADGEWLGSGSGNMYSYRLPIRKNFKFPVKGKYLIELEQNMRDNPLDYVSDAGVRVEKAVE